MLEKQHDLDRSRFPNSSAEAFLITEGALARQPQVIQRDFRIVPSTAEQLEALQHPKITPIRPLSEALQEIKTEALMPRSEAPDPIVLERLKQTPLARWLDYRPDPSKRRYDIGRPLEMLRVPASDEEAARIRGKSKANYTRVISTEEVMSKADALNNSFSFLSMYAKDAGDSFAQTSIHTQGETWDKQSDGIRNVAVDTLEAIAGTRDVVWVSVGDQTIVGFFRGKRDMQAMAEASVTAPIAAYQEHLPHLAEAQTEIQQERMSDVLDSERGSARKWIDVKEGRKDGMKRAWDDSAEEFSSLSYWFASEQIEGNGKLQQQGVGINHEPITWEKLALESPELALGDTSTRDLILGLDQYFSGGDTEDRFAVMFTWKEDTGCCGESVSALNSESEQGMTGETVLVRQSDISRQDKLPFSTNNVLRSYSSRAGGGRYDGESCSSCGKDRFKEEDGCKCSAAKS